MEQYSNIYFFITKW